MKVYSLEEAMRDLERDVNQFSEDVQKKAKMEIQTLAASAHALIVQKATNKLKSTRSMYLDNVDLVKIESSPQNEIWSVVLYQPARFIEDGQSQHNMIDYLTSGPKAKTSKDGHRYAIIPFKHNKPPSQMSLAQTKMANYVKGELQKRGLDKTITKDGKPVIGRAATVDLVDKGAPLSKHGKPLLQGLTIYQREIKTKNDKTMIKRDVMTFRVASTKQKGKGLWDNPGRTGVKIFEETAKELDVLWENIITRVISEA